MTHSVRRSAASNFPGRLDTLPDPHFRVSITDTDRHPCPSPHRPAAASHLSLIRPSRLYTSLPIHTATHSLHSSSSSAFQSPGFYSTHTDAPDVENSFLSSIGWRHRLASSRFHSKITHPSPPHAAAPCHHLYPSPALAFRSHFETTHCRLFGLTRPSATTAFAHGREEVAPVPRPLSHPLDVPFHALWRYQPPPSNLWRPRLSASSLETSTESAFLI